MDKIISGIVITITVVITFLAMWYMHKKMDEVKHEVIYERRKARLVVFHFVDHISYFHTNFKNLSQSSQAKLDRIQSARGSFIDISNVFGGLRSLRAFHTEEVENSNRKLGELAILNKLAEMCKCYDCQYSVLSSLSAKTYHLLCCLEQT